MSKSPNSTIIIIAVTVALFLSVIDWMFVVQPRLSGAAEARAATVLQLEANQALQDELDQRIADFENLPELKSQVWAVRDQFPTDVNADAVREDLEALAARHGFVMLGDNIGVPRQTVPGLSLEAALAPYGLESYVDTLDFTGLDAVTISIRLQGDYDRVMGVLDDLQVGDHRYFLISSIQVSAMAENLSANPPVAAGSIQVDVSGFFFVLDHTTENVTQRPAEDPMPGEEPLPSEIVPVPDSDRDFLLPAE